MQKYKYICINHIVIRTRFDLVFRIYFQPALSGNNERAQI